MIPGNNTMAVCTAVMIEAMQEYFDKRTTGKQVHVTNVEGSGSKYDATFTIHFSERAAEDANDDAS